MEAWIEALRERVLVRQKLFNKRADQLIKLIEAGGIDRNPYTERERAWLETFTVGKEGINLCCGNISIGDSVGIDYQRKMLGGDYAINIEDIYVLGKESVDYVITNHIESATSPVRMFFTINSVLKPGGKVAIVFADCDNTLVSQELDDIFMSPKKSSLYNRTTMLYYLRKAGFKDVSVVQGSTPEFLRAVGTK